ncbi:hypothetical protein QQ045_018392 [Rhodiola kirilowii]
MVGELRTQVIGLQETKMEGRKLEAVRRKLGFSCGFYVDRRGLAGGLALWWKADLDLRILSYSNSHIYSYVEDDKEFKFRITLFYVNRLRISDRLPGIFYAFSKIRVICPGLSLETSTRQKDFSDVVKEAWLNSGGDSQSLTIKLHQCEEFLKKWNGKLFGQVKTRMRNLKEQLELIRKINTIDEIRDSSGKWLKDEKEIAELVRSYFSCFIESSIKNRAIDWNQRLLDVQSRVPVDSENVLCGPITELEVQAVLFQIYPTKAPGPDGFSAIFFQKHWHFLKDTIIRRISMVFNEDKLEEGMNETMIVLIPKCKKPTKLEEYRPISLCNVTAKIVTKILANRLKTVLPMIISETQSKFIPALNRVVPLLAGLLLVLHPSILGQAFLFLPGFV